MTTVADVDRRDEPVAMLTASEGGIYDHLGGGFSRYSVDDRWLVPHFEKMLYDNAQLAQVYLHAWQVTGEPRYRQATATRKAIGSEILTFWTALKTGVQSNASP